MALRQANQYSTEFHVGACDPATALVGVAFGFEATHIRVRNVGTVPIRFSLHSTGAASTSDPELEAGAVFASQAIVISGLALTTTSTTTSTGDAQNRVTVAAWGGF